MEAPALAVSGCPVGGTYWARLTEEKRFPQDHQSREAVQFSRGRLHPTRSENRWLDAEQLN